MDANYDLACFRAVRDAIFHASQMDVSPETKEQLLACTQLIDGTPSGHKIAQRNRALDEGIATERELGPHDSVVLYYAPDNKHVKIDVKLAPLMKMMWSIGIETSECCQGDQGIKYGYIAFENGVSVDRFLDVIAKGDNHLIHIVSESWPINKTWDLNVAQLKEIQDTRMIIRNLASWGVGLTHVGSWSPIIDFSENLVVPLTEVFEAHLRKNQTVAAETTLPTKHQ